MKTFCRFILFFALGLTVKAYSWNALGHRLVAQIAYDQLTPQAKRIYNRYNRSLNRVYRRQSFVNAGPWLDSLRYRRELWLHSMHYIDIPFSRDGTKLIPPDKVNALSAIKLASNHLQQKKGKTFDKGFSLRILLHIVGDIHQPLHAANQFSKQHPKGDQGGNLVHLGANPVGDNLHSYWDKGGGLLAETHFTNSQLVEKARAIEKRWPCKLAENDKDPSAWAQESHELSISYVYKIKENQVPDKNYQEQAQALSEQQIAKAGCRLGTLLNNLQVR